MPKTAVFGLTEGGDFGRIILLRNDRSRLRPACDPPSWRVSCFWPRFSRRFAAWLFLRPQAFPVKSSGSPLAGPRLRECEPEQQAARPVQVLGVSLQVRAERIHELLRADCLFRADMLAD